MTNKKSSYKRAVGTSSRSRALKAFKITAIVFCIALSAVYVFSAFSGYVSPLEDSKMAYLGMVYPVLLIAMTIMIVIWALCKKYLMSILFLLPLICTFDAIRTFCPINNPFSTKDENKAHFTLMTYNVMEFEDFEEDVVKSVENRTIKYILEKNSDIVCLQESRYSLNNPANPFGISNRQHELLEAKYPHKWTGRRDLCLLSKFPIRRVNTISTSNSNYGCDLYEIDVNGTPVTIINVHLQSIGLSMTDKELYMDMTSISKTHENIDSAKIKVKEIRRQLISKLGAAFRERARQAKRIRNVLENIEGNVILCGDFNDTPNSYAYRQICENMHDAYRDKAFGPTITYHDNRFYFRIDHIFYRGGLKVVDIERGSNSSSDHYPVLATFEILNTKNN